jgi:hypothetical protein
LTSPTACCPFPIIVTEPAVGKGLGVAPVFFHAPEPPSDDQERIAGGRPVKPPSVSAAAALETESGTWAAGAGFPYLLGWRLGLHAGLDMARSPGQSAY